VAAKQKEINKAISNVPQVPLTEEIKQDKARMKILLELKAGLEKVEQTGAVQKALKNLNRYIIPKVTVWIDDGVKVFDRRSEVIKEINDRYGKYDKYDDGKEEDPEKKDKSLKQIKANDDKRLAKLVELRGLLQVFHDGNDDFNVSNVDKAMIKKVLATADNAIFIVKGWIDN
jgi:hypothetical protein